MIDLTMWHSIPEEENAGNSSRFYISELLILVVSDCVIRKNIRG